MAIRAGACLLILGAIALGSRAHMTRLPHVFSAVAQETLLIYFIHLCVDLRVGVELRPGARVRRHAGPRGTLGVVLVLIAAMAAMAAYWNWLKHARPRTAVWVGRVAMVVLVAGFVF